MGSYGELSLVAAECKRILIWLKKLLNILVMTFQLKTLSSSFSISCVKARAAVIFKHHAHTASAVTLLVGNFLFTSEHRASVDSNPCCCRAACQLTIVAIIKTPPFWTSNIMGLKGEIKQYTHECKSCIQRS